MDNLNCSLNCLLLSFVVFYLSLSQKYFNMNSLCITRMTNPLKMPHMSGLSKSMSSMKTNTSRSFSFSFSCLHPNRNVDAMQNHMYYSQVPCPSASILKYYPIVYTGEIGCIRDYSSRLITLHPSQEEIIREQPDLSLYKYGTSSDVSRRIKEHNRQFKYFDIKIIKGTLRHLEVEQRMTQELKHKNLLYKLMVQGKVKREILCFTEEWQKEWFVCLIDDLIRNQIVNQIKIDMSVTNW